MPRLALKRPVAKSFTRPCGRVVPPNHIPKQIHRLRRLHRLEIIGAGAAGRDRTNDSAFPAPAAAPALNLICVICVICGSALGGSLATRNDFIKRVLEKHALQTVSQMSG